ncbi:MAG: alpha/beta fold hydrolase [Cyanobium sp.]
MAEAIPLVLIHGLWDTPRVFRPLLRELDHRRDPLLLPHLPHGLGSIPLLDLAQRLDEGIRAAFGPDQPIDLLGFSMGGVIGRSWIQLLGGAPRTRRFISVASPHRGTLAAVPWPRAWLAGVADMKPRSSLLERLNADLDPLRRIDCCSFYCPTDLTVFPGWQAVLPVGRQRRLPVLRHDRLLMAPQGLKPLLAELLRP